MQGRHGTSMRLSKRFRATWCVLCVCFGVTLPWLIKSDPARGQPEIMVAHQVISVIEEIRLTIAATEYRHVTRVSRKRGEYFFDCSGMAVWVLKRSAPGALEAVGRPNGKRPLARDFYQKIARIPRGDRRGAWKHIGDVARARPGDVLAWIRPKWFPSKSTGHVAFILDHPTPNTGPVPGLLIRIADASKFRHEDDSRNEGETGFGIGTLLVPTDDAGRALGYGWVGSRTSEDWVVWTDLVIGRPLR